MPVKVSVAAGDEFADDSVEGVSERAVLESVVRPRGVDGSGRSNDGVARRSADLYTYNGPDGYIDTAGKQQAGAGHRHVRHKSIGDDRAVALPPS
ncbi:MAG TPA: hypothetical protein VM282_26700 [Acidimicrobiales bacterium]|nr:hypothetical protein [Acidimicrobiales bacterium]